MSGWTSFLPLTAPPNLSSSYLSNVICRPLRVLLPLCFLLLFSLEGRAQFGISPTDSLTSEFPTDSLTRIFQIDFPNETPDSLGLTWRWIDGGWTEGWDVNLCDLGECYTGVPADADMLPMPPEGTGFLKLIVNALDIEGACFLHFWVYPTGNPDALVDVYFDLRNGGVNAVTEWTAAAPPHVFPNPVRAGQDLILTAPESNLNFPLSDMQRFGGDGKLYPCIPTHTPQGWRLSTSGWPSGPHWIRWAPHRPVLRVLVE